MRGAFFPAPRSGSAAPPAGAEETVAGISSFFSKRGPPDSDDPNRAAPLRKDIL